MVALCFLEQGLSGDEDVKFVFGVLVVQYAEKCLYFNYWIVVPFYGERDYGDSIVQYLQEQGGIFMPAAWGEGMLSTN